MNAPNEIMPGTSKYSLKGWRWLAAWLFLIAALSVITWIVLGLTSTNSYEVSTVSRWLVSIGIAAALAISLGLLVHCFSSWRNLKRLLVGLASLAALIAIFYAEENIRGRLAWRLFKAHWEAKGEKFDFAALIPRPVPDDQNFAMAPVVATTYSHLLDRTGHRISPPNTNVVDRLKMPLDLDNGGPANVIGNWQKAIATDLEPWQNYYRDLSLTTNLYPVAPQPQSPAADVLLALSKYDLTIEELRRAAALPASRFPLNYDNGQPYAILLPHLAPLKGCAAVLRLRALAEQEAGQSQQALADISLALNLTEKIRSEPFLISQLVRIAMFQITLQPVWEGLAVQRWTDAQVSQLDQQLSTLDFVADYAAAMRGENVCQVASMDDFRHRPGLLDRVGEFGQKNSVGDIWGYLIPSGWFYQNERRSSKFILEQFLPIGDVDGQTFSPDLAREANQSLISMRRTPYTIICKMLLPGLANGSRRFAFAQASLNLSRGACALERYRLTNGKYPETLEALVPQFTSKVPRDPIAGQPLRYRSTEDGRFILYSVGWNEKDDGGHVSFNRSGSVDLEKGDWVWRYP